MEKKQRGLQNPKRLFHFAKAWNVSWYSFTEFPAQLHQRFNSRIVRCEHILTQSCELPEPLHLRPRSHGPILLHHLTHLQVLLQELVDLLDAGTASGRDALPSLPIDHAVITPL